LNSRSRNLTDSEVTASVVRTESSELAILCRAPYPNALVVGGASHTAGFIANLLARGARPVAHWDAEAVGESSLVPHGTLVIWSVEKLNSLQQHQLLNVLDDRRDSLQIISVAGSDLFARVQHGEFLDALYYRFNVVRVQPEATWPNVANGNEVPMRS
jgi:hypothetical protein